MPGGYAKSGNFWDFMPTIDEDLSQLEKDVRQLKIEFEQYFGGGRARPPSEIEWRIETLIKKYGERGSNMKFAQRYRYGALAQTYARYKEVFRKRLKQKEEGTVARHFGAAAKKIAAERASQQAATQRSSTVEVQRARGVSVSYSGVDREDAKTQKLYEAFRDAKQQAGENTSKLTLDAFQSFLERKTDELRKTNAGAKVEFTVSVEDGKVKLKARTAATPKSKTKS
jgi:cobalamin biosynthesis Mg chelatase CobN